MTSEELQETPSTDLQDVVIVRKEDCEPPVQEMTPNDANGDDPTKELEMPKRAAPPAPSSPPAKRPRVARPARPEYDPATLEKKIRAFFPMTLPAGADLVLFSRMLPTISRADPPRTCKHMRLSGEEFYLTVPTKEAPPTTGPHYAFNVDAQSRDFKKALAKLSAVRGVRSVKF